MTHHHETTSHPRIDWDAVVAEAIPVNGNVEAKFYG